MDKKQKFNFYELERGSFTFGFAIVKSDNEENEFRRVVIMLDMIPKDNLKTPTFENHMAIVSYLNWNGFSWVQVTC